MSRGLDHIVHAVHDLDAAADLYRRLGFTVGARNRHAWGTHNHIVQLPGFFVELLTVAEPEKLGTDGFSALFGTFNRLFLKQQEGLSLLILESANAVADVADFRAAKIGVSDAMRFEREAAARRLDRESRFLRLPSRETRRRHRSASPPASSTFQRISGTRPSSSTPTPSAVSPVSFWSPRT